MRGKLEMRMNETERYFEIDLDARKKLVRRSVAWPFLGLIGFWPLYAYLYFLGDDPEIGIGTDLTRMWAFCLFSGALAGIIFAFGRAHYYTSRRNTVNKVSVVDDEGISLRFAMETRLLHWNGIESIYFMELNSRVSKHIVIRSGVWQYDLFLEEPRQFLDCITQRRPDVITKSWLWQFRFLDLDTGAIRYVATLYGIAFIVGGVTFALLLLGMYAIDLIDANLQAAN